jgi:methyl-accepting chemotaxis protein
MSLSGLGVRTKILASVLVAVFVAGAVGVIAITLFSRLRADVVAVNDKGLVPVSQLADVRRWVLQTRVDALADVALDQEADHTAFLADLKQVDTAFAKYAAGDHNSETAAQITKFQTAWKQYTDLVNGPLLALGRAKNWTGYVQLRTAQVKPLATAYNEALTALEKYEAAQATSQVASAESALKAGRTTVILLLTVGSVLAMSLALLIASRIVRSVRQVSHVVDGLAKGDLTRTAEVHSGDELGRMAAGLDTSTAALRQLVTAVGGHAQHISRASGELTTVADRISTSVRETTDQSAVASAGAEQVATNVQTVAAGAEEMSASITEIAHSAGQAAQVAQRAVGVAANADSTVAKLGDSSTEIGNVVKMITSIAGQTNLLALNATIEAARAGDAGKGFAVVAGEVKELAQETAKATEDIARLVGSIQTDSAAAVESIQEIINVIDQINSFQTTIASAVEEQTATTSEMSRNVTEAATGTGEIAANMSAVAGAAQHSSEGVAAADGAIHELAQLADELRQLVGNFTY